MMFLPGARRFVCLFASVHAISLVAFALRGSIVAGAKKASIRPSPT
jgi:hypothetical protein